MKNQQAQKMDGGRWLEREITKLDPVKFWVEYPAKKARTVFPIDTSVGKGFKKYEYKTYDRVGIAKIMNSVATDIPRLNVNATTNTAKVWYMDIAKDFDRQELDAAAVNGEDLDTEFVQLAREAHIFKENDVAILGDSDNALDGLTANANVGDTVAPNGALGSPLWTGASAKTAQEVYADVSSLIDSVRTETKDTHMADTVLFPLSARPQLNQVYSSLSGDSVLTVLKKNYPEITLWEFLNELETAGDGSTRVMIAYPRDPMVLRMMVPFETEVLPPVPNEKGYTVVAEMGIGGLNIRRPTAIQKMYGF